MIAEVILQDFQRPDELLDRFAVDFGDELQGVAQALPLLARVVKSFWGRVRVEASRRLPPLAEAACDQGRRDEGNGFASCVLAVRPRDFPLGTATEHLCERRLQDLVAVRVEGG